MPMPVRSLPVLQNWDCHGCSNCCRTYSVDLTAAEQARIKAQGWEQEPEYRDLPLFAPTPGGGTRLAHREDDTCIFLGPDLKCRIHGKFGAAAKPRACRIYPFIMVPTGDHWRVGLRFSCPSAAENRGRPMSEQMADARTYAELAEADRVGNIELAPPQLQNDQSVPWSDLVRFAQTMSAILAVENVPIERKLRQTLELAKHCRQARFDGVSGARLSEFLEVMTAVATDEIPADPRQVARPGWAGRMVFRQIVALYARKDVGFDRGDMAKRGAFGRGLAAWRFAAGQGSVPSVHAHVPKGAQFSDAERPWGPLSPESESLLTRYYRTKVESLQFCGRTNFNLRFWDGFDALALTFPSIFWLARVLASGERSRENALRLAVEIVDDNFGFNPLLGTMKQKWALRVLGIQGELPRLIAWYGQ